MARRASARCRGRELAGEWFGTMCLSEPQAGSSLSDITTRAELEDEADPLGPATGCAATRCGSRRRT